MLWVESSFFVLVDIVLFFILVLEGSILGSRPCKHHSLCLCLFVCLSLSLPVLMAIFPGEPGLACFYCVLLLSVVMHAPFHAPVLRPTSWPNARDCRDGEVN